MIAHTIVEWLTQQPAPPPPSPAPLPNPVPVEPPGAKAILGLLNNVKWAAGIALMAAFFIGLTVWAGGRWVDHHRAGKVGLVMMLCAIGGAILYGIGYSLIDGFSKG
ncbi:hypothetical protein [Amycolatopsis sp. MJM2582]|uniref:hypothetical protein n=1 Tax=Amycolatopsis sp. MJM2582 TaxID=1427749 RepID=UPI000689973F|nr:hypothetical protein [Amycolatopsis sp. MJM2582]